MKQVLLIGFIKNLLNLLIELNKMERLIQKFQRKLVQTPLGFVRSLMDDIQWEARLIGIRGARGVGKTILLLQYIKLHHADRDDVLYASLDDLWFSKNSLYGLADSFYKVGGRYLFLDEVHKYPSWAQEVKNIYDDFTDMKIVFTGSSLLEILNARADLSRRAVSYQMQGLSFREFLNYQLGKDFPVYSLSDIYAHHLSIAQDVVGQIAPLKYFKQYLQFGYYPYFKEVQDLYPYRLEESINMILEIELPLLRSVDIAYSFRLKQLLMILAESVPFVPNISKLSQKIGISRLSLLSYLHYLQEAGLITRLYKATKGVSRLQKPAKIYIENQNISFVLNPDMIDRGSLREGFVVNQLNYRNKLEMPEFGDLLLNDESLLEIGGKYKTARQIKDWPEDRAFVLRDDIEFGYKNTIPLWLFGFTY